MNTIFHQFEQVGGISSERRMRVSNFEEAFSEIEEKKHSQPNQIHRIQVKSGKVYVSSILVEEYLNNIIFASLKNSRRQDYPGDDYRKNDYKHFEWGRP
ncbi:hypothetical protein [Leptospira interrogans]|uniref:hypothetical protein n=1 Tax=Leptospira interrogans TaxID=173 RepID=UPI000774BE9C|nr:hypothetical protein [Leptospira interrogans]